MADYRIGDLPAASALTGAETAEVVQSGNSRKVTLTTIYTWIQTQIETFVLGILADEQLLGFSRVRRLVFADSPLAVVTDTEEILIADTTSGTIVINLPAIDEALDGKRLTVKKRVAANTVTINRASTNTIDTATSYSMTAIQDYVTIIASFDLAGSYWIVVNEG